MPKTKKQSYAKRIKLNKLARQLPETDTEGNMKQKAIDKDIQQPVELIADDSLPLANRIEEAARKNRAIISVRISNIKLELDDRCINEFLKVLNANTTFEPQDPLLFQGVHWYRRVEAERDIQILYQGEIGPDCVGHWTCIYYNSSVVHVYDTLCRKLSPLQLEILNQLYGNCLIIYEKVQIQPDAVSCGVFACAIATSLALGADPTTEHYCIDSLVDSYNKNTRCTQTLRCHLLSILDQNLLIPFPTTRTKVLRHGNQQLQSTSTASTKLGIENAKSGKEDAVSKTSTTFKNSTYASVCQSQQRLSKTSEKTNNSATVPSSVLNDTPGQIMNNKIDIVQTKDRKQQWWTTHKDSLNKTRRENYSTTKDTPMNKERTTCIANSVAVRKQAETKYANERESRRAQDRKRYATNPEAKRAVERKRYMTNSATKKAKERQRYMANPETKKAQEKQRYMANPETKKAQEKQRYMANPEAKKSQERKRYAINPEIKKTESKEKYTANPTMKNEMNRKWYHANKERRSRSQNVAVSKNILKKYKRLDRQSNTIKLLGSTEKFINLISSKLDLNPAPKARIEAEKIVKWSIHARHSFIFGVKKSLDNIKRYADISLIKASETSDFSSKVTALCGKSEHTGSSEPYFADTIYNDLTVLNDPLVTTTTGKLGNVLPVCPSKHVRDSWICSSLCVEPDSHIIERLVHLLQTISTWKLPNMKNNIRRINVCSVNNSSQKRGHPQSCYKHPATCYSKLLPLQVLYAHFPRIRYFTRRIYELIKLIAQINDLDDSLNRGDVKRLREMSATTQHSIYTEESDSNNNISFDEDAIISKYSHAFEALAKDSMDMPRLDCMSCEKLCCRKDVCIVTNLRKPPSGPYWLELIEYIDNNGGESEYICHYCLNKFRHGLLPPTCILNGLSVRDIPAVVSTLNDYEKLFIQRAKAFQTVERAKTVAKRNIPYHLRIQKLKGRTFHLPLPLEETLKKLPLPTDAINRNHELYILVCGIPNKSNIVWSKLVGVKKVHEALTWLKNNNPFYSKIVIPAEDQLLLESCTEDVEIQIDPGQRTLGEESARILPLEYDAGNPVEHRAIVTQVMDEEQYCEQFTIYPIHEDRVNKSATALYQLLKVQEAPLSNWDKSLDMMCFPDLYPHGTNGQHENRRVHLREYDFVKCKLMSKHSCFRLNQQYIFYLLNNSNMRQLKSGIFHKLNVTNPREKINAKSYLEMLSKEQLEGNLTTIFARIRNTEQYWRKPRNDLTCMIQNYGPATWFLTLSPSEWLWEDLAAYIREVNEPDMASMSTSHLVASDPVSASRFLDIKFRAMLKFICSDACPVGKVTHYFWRREYQGRGTQHFHLLLWIEDAPIIDQSSAENIAKFINKYVTCKIPSMNVSPTIHRRVVTHQKHGHNDYCLRNKKNKKTGYSKVCRFGFPRPVTESLVLRDVGISIAGRKLMKAKSRLYDIPRSDQEVYINDYNPVILAAWEGNMDIQFIGEKSTVLTWYVTGYTTKPESTNAADMFDDINSTKTLSSRLWSVGLRSLKNRECGALEAADTLLGIPLYGTDSETTVRWLDVNQFRNRKVKSHKIVKELDPESTDIFCPSLIDDHYPNRPEELDSVSLYDFAKWYDITKNKPIDDTVELYELGNDTYLRRRKRGYLINHYKYNVNVQPENYFYALLLLFKPWRDTEELKYGCDSYTEAFDLSKAQLLEALEYHERLTDIQKGFDFVRQTVEKNIEDLAEKMNSLHSQESNVDNPLGMQPVEADVVMREFNQGDANIANVDLDMMISKLNPEQKRIFDNITSVLTSDNSEDVLRLFVSGAGGTGKSFLIQTIRCWTKQTLGKTAAVAAPTGLAAFNVDGLTIHRLFQLPIEHGGTPKYKELSDQVLQVLRQDLKDTVLFIIDEVSMISNVTLMYIHLRLSEIFDTNNTENGWFGGKHIILLGDLLQLPPVNDQSAFVKIPNDKVKKYLGSVGVVDLWTHLFTYDELTTNVRQQNDTTYAEMLTRVRFGIVTSADIDVLKSRQLPFLHKSMTSRLGELCDYIDKLPIETVCLFSNRVQCESINRAMLARIQSEEIELNAEDSIDCAPYLRKKLSKLLNQKREDTSRTAGLAKTIVIKIGAQIMIRRNIDVTSGLINGTIGHVISISRAIDTNEVESLKIAVSSGRLFTIERISTKFEIMDRAFIYRKQFPLSLSYGITIHKSQGLSLTSVVMDIGNSIFTSGQAYVALSRVTSLKGLHLINLDPHKIQVQEAALVEYNRLRSLYRSELPTIEISRTANPKIKDVMWLVPQEVDDVQTTKDSTKFRHCKTNVVGIDNIDNVSCYANATLQCMFHCPAIMKELEKQKYSDVLEILAHSYNKNNEKLNSVHVRGYANERFKDKTQQDAAEFLLALRNKSDVLHDELQHELIVTTRCNTCGLSFQRVQPNYIITLPIATTPDQETSPTSLQKLVESLSQWTQIDGTCENEDCHGRDKSQKTVIAGVKDVIVLQLMLFTYKNNKAMKTMNFRINAIPTSQVLVDGHIFRVTSAIFHHGNSIDHGHYSAMVKTELNTWLSVSDMQIRKMTWPRGAKNAYIFFLQRAP